MPWGLTPAHLIVLMVIVMIMVAPTVLVLAVLLRGSAGRPPATRYDPAVEQLRLRYGRGEINQAEFEESMARLGVDRRS